MGLVEEIRKLPKANAAKEVVGKPPQGEVLKKATTRFGLLEVTEAGAYFPEKSVFFSNQELGLVLDKNFSRQMIDGIFKLKEVFEGEVIGYEGDSTGN